MCSDIEIEKINCTANAREHEQQQKVKDDENRLMWLLGVFRPNPGTKRSIHVKVARKIHASHRQKQKVDGLYEVVAPDSTLSKLSTTASILKEPKKPEVKKQNSDMALFGTKHERNTDLDQFAERWSPKLNEKTLEQNILNHNELC